MFINRSIGESYHVFCACLFLVRVSLNRKQCRPMQTNAKPKQTSAKPMQTNAQAMQTNAKPLQTAKGLGPGPGICTNVNMF